MRQETYNRIEKQQTISSFAKIEIMAQESYPWLKSTPLFAGISGPQAVWLTSRLYPCAFEAAKEVLITGMPGDKVYVILSGTVKVYIPQTDGEEVIVAIFGPGDLVGEMGVFDHRGRSANVVTLEDTRMLWMSQAHFKEALRSIPALAQNLIAILSNRLRLSTGQIHALAALDVIGRVARQILAFADLYGVPGPDGAVIIPIRLTQNDLAGLVGASRKRVNQAAVELKDQGCIAVDARYYITILNRPCLENLLKR